MARAAAEGPPLALPLATQKFPPASPENGDGEWGGKVCEMIKKSPSCQLRNLIWNKLKERGGRGKKKCRPISVALGWQQPGLAA